MCHPIHPASVLLLHLLLLAGCATRQATDLDSPAAVGEAGRQVVASFSQSLEKTLEASYLLYLPQSYADDAEEPWPLIVHLHGGGGRGTDPERLRPYPPAPRRPRPPTA